MPDRDLATELNRLEMRHRFNADIRRLCEPMLPNGVLAIARLLLEENKRLRLERDQARQPINGQHDDPADCPTFYDGCNCSVETLVHNIERAEAAEAKLKEPHPDAEKIADMEKTLKELVRIHRYNDNRLNMDEYDVIEAFDCKWLRGNFRDDDRPTRRPFSLD